MNEEQVFFACKQMALNLISIKDISDKEGITKLYEIITSKLPDDKELKILQKGLDDFRSNYKTQNKELTELLGEMKIEPGQQVDFAAWSMLVNTMFSLDIMKTKD